MKILVLLALISLATADHKYNVRKDIAEQWEELYNPHKNECIQESGANKEDVEDLFLRGHYPDKHEFKCYLKCAGIKLRLFTEDHIVHEQNIQKLAKAGDLDLVEESAKSVSDEKDPCEKFYLFIVRAVARVAERYPRHD